jgi:hypothetical protein
MSLKFAWQTPLRTFVPLSQMVKYGENNSSGPLFGAFAFFSFSDL